MDEGSRDNSKNGSDGETPTVGEQTWWDAAVAWIQNAKNQDQAQGFVHDAIQISPQRVPYLNEAVETGTLLFRIPPRCLVCWSNVAHDDSFGKPLIDLLLELDTVNKPNGGTIENATTPTEKGFHNSPYDLALATFLASNPDSVKHYQGTLPNGPVFDAVPRRWTNDECRNYLTGSPLLARVIRERDGAKHDYDCLRVAWNKKHTHTAGTDIPFPSFEAFSDNLAAVTSRAFAGFGADNNNNNNNDNSNSNSNNSSNNTTTKPRQDDPDEDIAMVPLLDLCDHSRGAKNTTKNLSYELSKDGSVLVKAIQTIKKGETLRITYGARANGVLLLNYGFCIPDNVEPDGSSNDTLEFWAHNDGHENSNNNNINNDDNNENDARPAVYLRQGPKSHAFHGFINALDQFRPNPSTAAAAKQLDEFVDDVGIPTDVDDESEGNVSFDWGAAMTSGGTEENTCDDGEEDEEEDLGIPIQTDKEAVDTQLAAISAFQRRLRYLIGQYSLTKEKLDYILSQKVPSKQYYAAILVKSEHQIISFHLRVLEKLERLLSGNGSEEGKAAVAPTKSEIKMLDEQAASIATTFMAIRFSEL